MTDRERQLVVFTIGVAQHAKPKGWVKHLPSAVNEVCCAAETYQRTKAGPRLGSVLADLEAAADVLGAVVRIDFDNRDWREVVLDFGDGSGDSPAFSSLLPGWGVPQ